MKNILLIGCGHMGGSLMSGWSNSKNYTISVLDKKKYALHHNIQLATMYNIWGPIHKIIHNIHLYTTNVTITNGLFMRQIII